MVHRYAGCTNDSCVQGKKVHCGWRDRRHPGYTDGVLFAGDCLHLGCETVRLLGNVNRMMLFCRLLHNVCYVITAMPLSADPPGFYINMQTASAAVLQIQTSVYWSSNWNSIQNEKLESNYGLASHSNLREIFKHNNAIKHRIVQKNFR